MAGEIELAHLATAVGIEAASAIGECSSISRLARFKRWVDLSFDSAGDHKPSASRASLRIAFASCMAVCICVALAS